ncbi:MAG: hypothetical protein ABI460_05670 [Caldimonas sp.]
MNRLTRCIATLAVCGSAAVFFFVIIGVFGIAISLAGLVLFVILALAMCGRSQRTETPE